MIANSTTLPGLDVQHLAVQHLRPESQQTHISAPAAEGKSSVKLHKQTVLVDSTSSLYLLHRDHVREMGTIGGFTGGSQ